MFEKMKVHLPKEENDGTDDTIVYTHGFMPRGGRLVLDSLTNQWKGR